MQDYNGNEMQVRETKTGKFQALPATATANDMSRAPVFATREEAEAYIARPMPQWVADERAHSADQEPYIAQYASVLARPELREMRRQIQEHYGEAMHQSKLANDAQRAAIRGAGHVSCIGRDVGAARQGTADYQADEASEAWGAYGKALAAYEIAVQTAMREANIPIALFRSPVLV